MKKHALSLITASGLALVACHPAPEATRTSGLLLRVGGEEATEAELALELDGATDPTAREAALARLTERKRMVAEAKATGLTDDPAVRRALDGVLVRFLQERTLQPQLDAIAIDPTTLATRSAAAAAQPVSTELTVAILFLRSHEADVARRQAHRQQLGGVAGGASELPTESGFGARALEASEHAESRFQGGIVPPLTIGATYDDWRDGVLRACANLAPGEVSPVIETRDGLYLARVVERRAAATAPAEVVREKLRREALREEEESVRRRFAEDMARKFPVWLASGASGD